MWMNAAKTTCASGASVSILMALSCACVRLVSSLTLTQLTVKVRQNKSGLWCPVVYIIVTTDPKYCPEVSTLQVNQHVSISCLIVMLHLASYTVGYDWLSIASRGGALVKVSKPGLEVFLHVLRTEGCLNYVAGAWTPSPLREVWMTPL